MDGLSASATWMSLQRSGEVASPAWPALTSENAWYSPGVQTVLEPVAGPPPKSSVKYRTAHTSCPHTPATQHCVPPRAIPRFP